MNDIIGVALLLAAVAALNIGKWVAGSTDDSGSLKVRVILEASAIGFAATSALGTILLVRELAQNRDPAHVVTLAVALVAAFFGSRLVSAYLSRRLPQRSHPSVPSAAR